MNRTGRLFVISGPSGAGKGTLLNKMIPRIPEADIDFSVSCTTRKPRPGESDGVHYHFISVDEFEKRLRNDEFLEHNFYCNDYYGTLFAPIKTAAAKGKSTILEIDYNGMKQVREKYPAAVKIFIAPPSLEVLEQRLRLRGSESDEQIERRLNTAKKEMQFSGEYDHVVVNDNLEKAVDELVEIFNKYI